MEKGYTFWGWLDLLSAKSKYPAQGGALALYMTQVLLQCIFGAEEAQQGVTEKTPVSNQFTTN